ncbi:MAG: putative manganese transporter [Bacteroidales bacterium]|jgi:hypothetical protein|nr:putative manganese transporter [Bacteroidales bacterium]
MIHVVSPVIQNTLIITSFVMIMMLLIEYVNVYSHGKWINHIGGSGFKQLLMATLLGLLPGCLGGFIVVSLFTHNMVSFGALVACLIASFGDEAFAMLAVIPKTALLLSGVLLIIAMLSGLTVNLLFRKFPTPFDAGHFELHDSDRHTRFDIRGNWRENLRHLSFERALLLAGITATIVFILAGWFDHRHELHDGQIMTGLPSGEYHHHHGEEKPLEHEHAFSALLLQERWINIMFSAVCLVALFIIVTVRDHFLKKHLWEHIIKKHLPRIFLWTLGILTLLGVGQYFVDVKEWIIDNPGYMLVIAVLIGLIPESGPHMIFITLFASGTIPFSVLLANSIVQEGHAGLPLLAESGKGFFWMKTVSVIVGFLAGIFGYWFGF